MTRPAVLLLAIGTAFAAEDLPAWVRDAAAKQSPAYSAKTPAVVLFQEETLVVDGDGRRVMTERGVIRKLSAGRVPLVASRAYNIKNGRIRDFRAWVLSPSGKETRYGRERIVEISAAEQNEYNETKIKTVSPGEDWQQNGVFAYEIVEEEKSLFTQYSYAFQDNLPVLQARFTLTAPPGWEARGQILNQPESKNVYSASGATHTWELTALPWLEDEDYGPERHERAPRLALTYFPGETRAGLRPLKDWPAVSAWVASLADAQADTTAAIQEKAAQLTAGAATPLDKIRAIAAFVQRTTYVSIQMNLTRGGGYTPHKASDVLTKNYGDCKDKANLMKALLAAAGIDSYLVAIYSGARDFVRPEWPSTMQFNHMIIAVKAPGGVALPTILDHPGLGRLLFFDPTDSYTPVGDLPSDEQGSHALVIAGDKGGLVKVPIAPAASNRVVSETAGVMAPDGGVTVKTAQKYFGQSARSFRSFSRRVDEPTFRKYFERILTRRLGGLTLQALQSTDSPSGGQWDLTLEFQAQQFGKLMQGRLLIVTPGAMLASRPYALPPMDRKLPVKLEAQLRQDRVVLQLPEGFQMDELPDPVHLKGPFGEFQAKWKADGRTLEMEQTLEVHDFTVPAADYAKVRDFFEQVGGAESAAAVLVKK